MVYGIIDERQTGKTELAVDLFLKNPEKNIIVCKSSGGRSEIIARILEKNSKLDVKKLIRRIKNSSIDALIGEMAHSIIFDEFFYFSDKEELLKSAYPMIAKEGNIYIIGTYQIKSSDKSFLTKKTSSINTVKGFRKNMNKQYQEPFEKYYDEFEESNS